MPADLGPEVAAAAGEHHTAAVNMDGTLVCFGCDPYGQWRVPADLGPVVAVAAGPCHPGAVNCERRVCMQFHSMAGATGVRNM